MMYAAVELCPQGGVVRHEETQEVVNVLIGDFETEQEAIQQACSVLECTELRHGVMTKGDGKGGYMIVTTQELESV